MLLNWEYSFIETWEKLEIISQKVEPVKIIWVGAKFPVLEQLYIPHKYKNLCCWNFDDQREGPAVSIWDHSGHYMNPHDSVRQSIGNYHHMMSRFPVTQYMMEEAAILLDIEDCCVAFTTSLFLHQSTFINNMFTTCHFRMIKIIWLFTQLKFRMGCPTWYRELYHPYLYWSQYDRKYSISIWINSINIR